MRQEVTQEMADDFNAEMVIRGSAYRVLKAEGNDYAWEINVLPDPFEKMRPMIYPNKEFYELLESHFQKSRINIAYNNTRTTFWADYRV